MNDLQTETHTKHLSLALDIVVAFFDLAGAAFYFSKRDEPTSLIRVAAGGLDCGVARESLLLDAIHLQGPLSVGSAAISKRVDGAPAETQACMIRYPLDQTAVLMVWPTQVDNRLLDDRSFCELTRLLSIPICVAQLGAELKQEADLRMLQSRNMAHTIRSNFQGVMGDVGAIRVLLNRKLGGLPVSVKEVIEHLEDLVLYLNNLLRSQEIVEHRFLKTARGIHIERKKQRVWDLLAEAHEKLRRRAADSKINIKINPEISELSEVSVDPGALSLVFLLLLDNALKYSDRGTVSRSREITVTGFETDEHVHIEIADFGLGVHPEEYTKIFQPYVQGSIIDEKRPITGQGIGLAAAREIVQAHGGDIVLARCIAYKENGIRISESEVRASQSSSAKASSLLQHCLVVFRLSLTKD